MGLQLVSNMKAVTVALPFTQLDDPDTLIQLLQLVLSFNKLADYYLKKNYLTGEHE